MTDSGLFGVPCTCRSTNWGSTRSSSKAASVFVELYGVNNEELSPRSLSLLRTDFLSPVVSPRQGLHEDAVSGSYGGTSGTW